jgi:glycosyltransferase involved in cell wall biosynthesis
MKITHFLISMKLEAGGVVRAVLDWTALLPRAGMEVTLLTADASDVPEAWRRGEAAGIRVVELPGGHRGSSLSKEQVRQAAEVIRETDVLHLHGAWDIANWQLSRVARREGRPYVISPHGMLDRWAISHKWLKKRVYFTLVGRRLFESAAAVHCAAEAEAEQARQWIRPKKLAVIPLPLDLSPFAVLPDPATHPEAAHLRDEGPAVLFLSRIHPVKRLELLIEAVSLLNRQGRRVRLLVAGTGEPGYVAGLGALAEERGVGEGAGVVKWLGMVRGEEKLLAYRSAAVFALPSHQENFGMVLAESLACGTPVITTRGADIWRELSSAGGEIVEPTAEGFAGGIARLLDDPAGLAERGRRGREWVMRWLDAERLGGEYGGLYEGARV